VDLSRVSKIFGRETTRDLDFKDDFFIPGNGNTDKNELSNNFNKRSLLLKEEKPLKSL